MGMKRKSKASCHGTANLLGDVREDALQGFARGSLSAAQAVRITVRHGLLTRLGKISVETVFIKWQRGSPTPSARDSRESAPLLGKYSA